jgi:hypothetical protein
MGVGMAVERFTVSDCPKGSAVESPTASNRWEVMRHRVWNFKK